ncbi:MAG: type III-B CRISPR module RAMP protein Cmr1 [Dictyoglomaceae bacterium]|nr:type III-B CRISPR module RAMP protein Cmr1 [Dictyoglomaceae bacterium]
MYTLTLKCKIITPLFMSGADGRTPELRPSEFKGMMRWWWRAIRAEDNIDNLRKEEAEIFGGTEKKEGRSKVKIKIKSNIENSDIIDYQPLPHHKRDNCPIDKNPRCNKAFKLKAIKSDKMIDIEFHFIPSEIEKLIYLMFILGGFGKRARRGFGSLQIIEPKIEITIEKILEFLNDLQNIYKIDKSYFLNISNIAVIKNIKPQSGIYPWINEIILGKREFSNKDDILKAIGKASHNTSDPALGLANPRMSSPVYVSVIEIQNRFYPIITVLNSYYPVKYPNYNLNAQKNFIKELVL